MELSSLLTKVRGLVALAEHPATPAGEAASARESADRLMLKYAVDEATLDATRPRAERGKPDVIEVDLAGYSGEVSGWVASLAKIVAQHCRCRIRSYTRYDSESRCWMGKVYGFTSDLRYFEVLYTTLRLHMLGVLAPGVRAEESFGANVLRLHDAGYNYLEIAQQYGWRKSGTIERAGKLQERWVLRSEEGELREEKTNWQLGSLFRGTYLRALKAAGRTDERTYIAAGGARTYRNSAAQGYVTRIRERLGRSASAQPGAEVVLAGRMDDLDSFFRSENPDLYQEAPEQPASRQGRSRAYKPLPFSEAAYRAGSRHADSADLGGGVGGARRSVE